MITISVTAFTMCLLGVLSMSLFDNDDLWFGYTLASGILTIMSFVIVGLTL
jgi:hypothetical protein